MKIKKLEWLSNFTVKLFEIAAVMSCQNSRYFSSVIFSRPPSYFHGVSSVSEKTKMKSDVEQSRRRVARTEITERDCKLMSKKQKSSRRQYLKLRSYLVIQRRRTRTIIGNLHNDIETLKQFISKIIHDSLILNERIISFRQNVGRT